MTSVNIFLLSRWLLAKTTDVKYRINVRPVKTFMLPSCWGSRSEVSKVEPVTVYIPRRWSLFHFVMASGWRISLHVLFSSFQLEMEDDSRYGIEWRQFMVTSRKYKRAYPLWSKWSWLVFCRFGRSQNLICTGLWMISEKHERDKMNRCNIRINWPVSVIYSIDVHVGIILQAVVQHVRARPGLV